MFVNIKQRAKVVAKILNELYPSPAIPLQHFDAYTLLIAVLLSARCMDARVNTITPKLFSLAKTPQEMVRLSIEQIQEIIRPCGLSPRKASAIWNLSKILIEKHQGIVPCDFELLEELPGVGHKTASVVMAQAFHVPAFPVDTHIFRSARRWKLSSGKTVEKVEGDLKKLYPKSEWIKLHLQIIYFSREYCPALKHNLKLCPICSLFTDTKFGKNG
ncbi:MAG: endonuclease III [Chlamydiales bacterium]|nr:endonuclease III [Chlamydiales bacterium]